MPPFPHRRRPCGGAGRPRGGTGVVRRVRFLEPMTAAILSEHRKVPPHGLDGGEPGTVGRNPPSSVRLIH